MNKRPKLTLGDTHLRRQDVFCIVVWGLEMRERIQKQQQQVPPGCWEDGSFLESKNSFSKVGGYIFTILHYYLFVDLKHLKNMAEWWWTCGWHPHSTISSSPFRKLRMLRDLKPETCLQLKSQVQWDRRIDPRWTSLNWWEIGGVWCWNMSPNDKHEAFQRNRLHGDINAWTKWCQVLGGAADVAEDDQKIQLFILAFNQIKEVESGVAFGSRERWCCFILLLPGWCEVNSLAGNWSQWSQWDHPEVARLSDMMTIHLAIQQCTKFEGIPWGEHVFFSGGQLLNPPIESGADLIYWWSKAEAFHAVLYAKVFDAGWHSEEPHPADQGQCYGKQLTTSPIVDDFIAWTTCLIKDKYLIFTVSRYNYIFVYTSIYDVPLHLNVFGWF